MRILHNNNIIIPISKFDIMLNNLWYSVIIRRRTTVEEQEKKLGEKKVTPHLAGLEPATFRLTAERANRLRHKCKSDAGLKQQGI